MTKEAKHTLSNDEKLYVLDFRASTLRQQGWQGDPLDVTLITNKTGKELLSANGDNSVIAKISFDNRDEELQDCNFADANRLVDCWNACEGLDPSAIKFVVEGLKAIAAFGDPYQILEDPEEFGGPDDGPDTLAMSYENMQGIARQALSKVRGEGKG